MNEDLEVTLRREAPTVGRARIDRARAALAERAGREGLVDVSYSWTDSPLGPLLVAVTPRGLVRVAYRSPDPAALSRPIGRGARGQLADDEDVLQDLAARLSPRILEDRRPLEGVRRELDEYFEGRRRTFETPIDWSLTRGFGRRVLEELREVPYGVTSTYLAMATAAGSPRGSRAAGNALGSNPMPIVVPCHRVLHSGGGIGGYTGGLDKKRYLLRLEGALD